MQQADATLRARLNHLSQCEIKGPHPQFDIPAEKCIQFRPTAFLGNMLSMDNTEFSSFQLGLYLQLVLGLDFSPQLTSDGNCPCGRTYDATGYHRLNCTNGLADPGHRDIIWWSLHLHLKTGLYG